MSESLCEKCGHRIDDHEECPECGGNMWVYSSFEIAPTCCECDYADAIELE